MLTPWKKSYDQLRQHIKKQRHYFANKGPPSQSCVFSSSHVWMWELDHKESWGSKDWCFRTVMVEKILESPLEIKPVNPKRTSTPNIHWKDWCWSSNTLAIWCKELTHQKRPWCWARLKAGEGGMTEDEMVGWHHWLDGHEFGQAHVNDAFPPLLTTISFLGHLAHVTFCTPENLVSPHLTWIRKSSLQKRSLMHWMVVVVGCFRSVCILLGGKSVRTHPVLSWVVSLTKKDILKS